MNREVHVRFCEKLEGRFFWLTRPSRCSIVPLRSTGQFLSRSFVVLLRKMFPQNHNLKTAAELGVSHSFQRSSMLLNLDIPGPRIKRVYELSEELRRDPEQIRLTQALTLNPNKPLMGLKGSHGLFGSEEWWQNIENRKIKTRIISGVIERTSFAGQDSRWGDQVNCFTLNVDDGTKIDEGIYAKQKSDRKLFVPGAEVLIAYVLDELKRQPAPDGGINYLEIVVEMAVSVGPALQ